MFWLLRCISKVFLICLAVLLMGGGTSTLVRSAAAQAPDLEISDRSVTPTTLAVGQDLSLSATVTNVGDAASDGTDLIFLESLDSAIAPTDRQIGSSSIGGLEPTESDSGNEQFETDQVGTFFYGACVVEVDGETETANNCSTGVQVTVTAPPAPDLVISVNDAQPRSVEVNDPVGLSATVLNQGDGDAATTTLRFFRSTDPVITTGDDEVDRDAIGALGASASQEGEGQDNPSQAGTFFYGACVNAVAGESDPDNNCSPGIEVTVTAAPPPTEPDLIVINFAPIPTSLQVGQTLNFSATVVNQGDGAAEATILRFYQSNNATIRNNDREVGTDQIGALAPSTNEQGSGQFVTDQVGTFFFGACVDDVGGESVTNNNCSEGIQVTITDLPPPPAPDLVVINPDANPKSLRVGQTISLSATVLNQGTGGSDSTTVRFRRSVDATISTSDPVVGTDGIGGLSGGASTSTSDQVTADQVGTFFYGACVDADPDETITGNNCSTGVSVTISNNPPPPPGNVKATDNDPNKIRVTWNLVSGASYKIFRNTTNSPPSGQQPIATAPNGTTSFDDSNAAANQTFWYFVKARRNGLDSAFSNSDSGIRPVPPPAPTGVLASDDDLTKVRVTWNAVSGASYKVFRNDVDSTQGATQIASPSGTSFDDLTVPQGQTFFYFVKARRNGLDSVFSAGDSGTRPSPMAPPPPTGVTASDDNEDRVRITWNPVSLASYKVFRNTVDSTAGAQQIGAPAGSIFDDTIAPQGQTFFYFVKAVRDGLDSDFSVGDSGIRPAPDAPDLTAAVVTDLSSVNLGQPIVIAVRVVNAGTLASAPTTLIYRLSTDNVIDEADAFLAGASVPGLAIAGFFDDSTAATLPGIGTFFVGVCVSAAAGETNLSNNCSNAVEVIVLDPDPNRPDQTQVFASVLPSSRSGLVGQTVTAAAAMVNGGATLATGCRVDPPAGLAAGFAFRPTDPVNNAPIGIPNQVMDVGAGSLQTFVLSITPSAEMPPTDLNFSFSCTNALPATSISGVNTLLFSASSTPVPDMVALAATPRGDGIVDVPISGSALFAVATSNVGASATITARAVPRPGTLPLDFSICQTDAATGACATAPAAAVTTTAAAGSTPAFGIFVNSRGQPVAFDPAANRAVVEFLDGGGVVRGSTSVAVQTVGDPPPPPPVGGPDLFVSGLSSSHALQEVNRSIAISSTVTNQGPLASADTVLRHFVTTDSSGATNLTEVATTAVGGLASGGSSSFFTPVTTPSQPNTYYYVVCVDPAAGEQNPNNNCVGPISVIVTADGGRD